MKFSALDYAQRDLHYAIVDEVDSILIDEARTPLIISGQGEASSHKYQSINEVIPRLRKDEHYVVDEKQHSVSLTDEGVEHAQKLMGISNLYDPVNLESLHILNQCLRAHALYKRDVNYLVADDGKVLIIDEFTGRVLPGPTVVRRAAPGGRGQGERADPGRDPNDGDHHLPEPLPPLQEARGDDRHGRHRGGGVPLDLQARPSSSSRPTSPIIRIDHEDLVYKTEREKFSAVTRELLEYHERGQPVLVGTTSVEKSAAVAKLLKQKKIPHAVLNAKQHEKEAFVVAQAGRKGAITVSTNMAGRGTDIILGGNPEMLAKLEFKEAGRDQDKEPEAFAEVVARYEEACKAEGEEVKALGGLHILGTERHESRRIDNQLRGRSGRQGDPGSSRFYLSLEDDLMRIFAGDKVKSLMERMGMPDDEPIEHPWVTKSIGDAQGKVEGRNFDMRKHVLEYDDVMSEQRKTVYTIRQQLLLGIYRPEYMDESGKPTGKIRKIAPLDRLKADVEGAIREMILHYGTPMPTTETKLEELKRPTSVEEVTELFSIESLRSDIYQYWGYRFDYKESEAKKPQRIYERLLTEIPQSLSEQRERLLDLMDGIIGAMVEECCPTNKPPEDWDWKGIRTGFLEHFGVKPVDFEMTPDLDESRAQALPAGVGAARGAREEHGHRARAPHLPALLPRGHRPRVGRAPHQHGAPARRHRPARLRSEGPEAGVQEGGLRHLHRHDGVDELVGLQQGLQCPAEERKRDRAGGARGSPRSTLARSERCRCATGRRSTAPKSPRDRAFRPRRAWRSSPCAASRRRSAGTTHVLAGAGRSSRSVTAPPSRRTAATPPCRSPSGRTCDAGSPMNHRAAYRRGPKVCPGGRCVSGRRATDERSRGCKSPLD